MKIRPRILALGSAGLLASALASAAPVREFHRTLPLAADGRVAISTYKGSIQVSCWDRPQVEVSARIEPDGSDSDADRRVEQTEVAIDAAAGSIRIRSNYDGIRNHHFLGLFGFSNGALPFVHYTVRMPATARLDIDDYKSDTRIAGLRADLKVHTYKGQVDVERLDGAARIDTYKGEIRVGFSRYSRPSRFETYKGSVDVRLPRDSRFSLDADGGRRGGVASDFAVASRRSGRLGGESARGDVNGGGPVLRFETSRGSLRLRGE